MDTKRLRRVEVVSIYGKGFPIGAVGNSLDWRLDTTIL